MEPLQMLQQAIAADPNGFAAMSQQERTEVIRGVFKAAAQQSGGSLRTGTPAARSYFDSAYKLIDQPVQGIQRTLAGEYAEGARAIPSAVANLTTSGALLDRATGQALSGGVAGFNPIEAAQDIWQNRGTYLSPRDPNFTNALDGAAARTTTTLYGAAPAMAVDALAGGALARGLQLVAGRALPALSSAAQAGLGVVGGGAVEGAVQGLAAPEGNLANAALGAGVGALGGAIGLRGQAAQAASPTGTMPNVDVEVRTFLSHSTLNDLPDASARGVLSPEAEQVLWNMYQRSNSIPVPQNRYRPGENPVSVEEIPLSQLLPTAAAPTPAMPRGTDGISLPDIGPMPAWDANGNVVRPQATGLPEVQPTSAAPTTQAATPSGEPISLPDIGKLDPWNAEGKTIPISQNRENLQAILRGDVAPKPKQEAPPDNFTMADKERLKLVRGVIKAAVAVPQKPAKKVADVVREALAKSTQAVRMMEAADAADGIPLPPKPSETPTWWKNLSVEDRRFLTHAAIKERELGKGNPNSFR